MATDMHAGWLSMSVVVGQSTPPGGGADPIFNQSNPGAGPSGTNPGGQGATGGPVGGGARTPSPFADMLLPLMLIFGVMIIFTTITSRRQNKKRSDLLNSIKKYDKVMTTGGIIGTVVELRDDEVVLKVDEHSSTKIRFTRSAIQQVLRPPADAPGKDADADESKSKGESVGAKG